MGDARWLEDWDERQNILTQVEAGIPSHPNILRKLRSRIYPDESTSQLQADEKRFLPEPPQNPEWPHGPRG